MKTSKPKQLVILFFSIFVFLSNPKIIGQSLSPQQAETLYHHMVEINKEWKHHESQLLSANETVTFTSDEQRIQIHLKLVTRILQKREVDGLSANQLKKRTQLLAKLEGYFLKGIFPENSNHSERQPYFVGRTGQACAVGYLMLSDGQENLVQDIRTENNNAYVNDLVMIYDDTLKWATDNGFTKEELAWIQPGFTALQYSGTTNL